MNFLTHKTELEDDGFAICENLYSEGEVVQILDCIGGAEKEGGEFSHTQDLFAIRRLLQVIPELENLLFNEKLKVLLGSFFNKDFFFTKSIYFDKPPSSNWFVAYHQDLSITVNKKADVTGYENWTFKKGQYGVQPPLEVLQGTVTVRVHLDDTDQGNGALRVIPKSHLKGIYRPESINWDVETEHTCVVKRGGAMLMKPLTLHASSRTVNEKQRRVIHLEFCDQKLMAPLAWEEGIAF